MESTKRGDLVPLSEATKVERLDKQTYRVDLVDSFCVGTVPNGGYVASCVLRAASIHLEPAGQPDVLNAHFQFLNRAEIGAAIIVIEDIKLGRQLSTLHATLYQHALLPCAPWITQGSTRKEIAAYLTMADLGKERGISLPTSLTLQHPVAAPPRPDFAALKDDRDAHWSCFEFTRGSRLGYTRSLQNIVYYEPRGGQPTKTVIDKWVRLASGERFTAAALAFASDCWPYVVEAWRPSREEAEERRQRGESVPFAPDARFWYPTVVLNLEMKKALPRDGLEWLQLRIQSKKIKNGRFDLEVLLLDEHGDLVASSTHVNLVLGSERNTAQRRRRGDRASEDPPSRL